jgi:hypothetical protein
VIGKPPQPCPIPGLNPIIGAIGTGIERRPAGRAVRRREWGPATAVADEVIKAATVSLKMARCA